MTQKKENFPFYIEEHGRTFKRTGGEHSEQVCRANARFYQRNGYDTRIKSKTEGYSKVHQLYISLKKDPEAFLKNQRRMKYAKTLIGEKFKGK